MVWVSIQMVKILMIANTRQTYVQVENVSILLEASDALVIMVSFLVDLNNPVLT
jgi:hypothetical protein